ncbi:glycerate kinase [Natrialbaceae archaeon A-CW3]
MQTIKNRSELIRSNTHKIAIECLEAGIEAAIPSKIVDETITIENRVLSIVDHRGNQYTYNLNEFDDVYVLGGGNGAGHLAHALEQRLGGAITAGAIVTDQPVPCETVEMYIGDHPIPSERGAKGARRVLELAETAGPNDLVLACITGGGSAIIAAPVDGVSVSDLARTTEALLQSGAAIEEINAVRKHCSQVKGGGLARACAPATVPSLLISDVIGDDPSVIASGPTVPDPTTYADALSILDRYDVDLPKAVEQHLNAGTAGDRPETPGSNHEVFECVQIHILGSNHGALRAAADVATEHGYEPLILSSRIRGESQAAAITHAAIAEECARTGLPIEPPAVVLSGGETTVRLDSSAGEGGPNQEFVTSGSLALDNDDIVIGAVDTDGIDGATDVAGAIADGTTIPPDSGRKALETHNVFPLLSDLNVTVQTGPTGTNVNDLRVLVIATHDTRFE